MWNQQFIEKIKGKLSYSLTPDQDKALQTLTDFLEDTNINVALSVKGYAGTGKSSLIGAFVQVCRDVPIKVVLLAPTGRAAKVFSVYSNYPAFTIHKKIYRLNKYTGTGGTFSLTENIHKDTLFIVDEASMIANNHDSTFTSGRLLDDLIEYVYAGDNCRLILIGDDAQLPPVGETLGNALDPLYLRASGLELYTIALNQVARQESNSGILANATLIRSLISADKAFSLPQLEIRNFNDTISVDGTELIDALEQVYSRDSIHETILITRSNKKAFQFNMGIRNRVLYREEMLSSGELLMVTKNNYYWLKEYMESAGVDFLANGEMLEVVRVRRSETLYDFNFINLTVRIESMDVEIDLKIIAESLLSETSTLPSTDQNRLYEAVMEDFYEEKTKAAKYRKLKENEYFNAVHVKYGYAVTCHKAQGGQWKNVFVDVSNLNPEYLDESFYKWLYTAITRATHRLWFINPPEVMKAKQ